MTQKSKENSVMILKTHFNFNVGNGLECVEMVGNGGEWWGMMGNGGEWVGMMGIGCGMV